uniref:BTB domain-containing protein n=1 Tax=Leersia perrieri TaxID=77586 RepID=A0A0D9X5L3_9ORYZ
MPVITKTSSTSILEKGTHTFKISGYSSKHRGLGINKYIRSAAFAVGGYEWCIRCYLDGISTHNDHVSVYLHLLTMGAAEVRAVYTTRLVVPSTADVLTLHSTAAPVVFAGEKLVWGSPNWKKRSELESSPFLRGDCLVIECDVTVLREPRLEEVAAGLGFDLPPSNLSDNLRRLLETGEDLADVTFDVKGEIFRAHKIVLAMRSPVFKAELYGTIGDNGQDSIIVNDMEPADFKEMLHYIYSDSLPSIDDLNEVEGYNMAMRLLVAANKYAMERMKLMCESILCKRIDAKRVLFILTSAYRCRCGKLKDSCFEFINSLDRLDELLASQQYQILQRAHPAFIVDIWEKVAMSRKK